MHNYQRSFPLRSSRPRKTARHGRRGEVRPSRRGTSTAEWTLDKPFDGRTDTRPEGVIYVVTGAGGQHLYNPEQQDDPASWQEFTYKFVSRSTRSRSPTSTARP